MDSGVYHGVVENVLVPKLCELHDIPEDKLLMWNLYTTSDFKMFRDDKQHKEKKATGKSNG